MGRRKIEWGRSGVVCRKKGGVIRVRMRRWGIELDVDVGVGSRIDRFEDFGV